MLDSVLTSCECIGDWLEMDSDCNHCFFSPKKYLVRVDTLPLLVLFYQPQKESLWSLLPQFESSPHSVSLSTGAAVRCQAEIKKERKKNRREGPSSNLSDQKRLADSSSSSWPVYSSSHPVCGNSIKHFVHYQVWVNTVAELQRSRQTTRQEDQLRDFLLSSLCKTYREYRGIAENSIHWCFHFLFTLSPSCHYKQCNWYESKLTSAWT